MLENLSDRTLLEALGEQVRFRILYSRYWEALYKKAFHRFGNIADSEDAVQEIFISIWRNKSTIQIEETLAPYLFTALKYPNTPNEHPDGWKNFIKRMPYQFKLFEMEKWNYDCKDLEYQMQK